MVAPFPTQSFISLVDQLPILGVCGWSGSGKTTLLEKVIPVLSGQGLRVAVIKHDAHGVDIDRPGKDSDRLYKAGADIFLSGDQIFHRIHPDRSDFLERQALRLARSHDLVLVEGHKFSNIQKVWLLGEKESAPPPEARSIVHVLRRDDQRLDNFLFFFHAWFAGQWSRNPIFGCVLIGGRSKRMGRAKHLLRVGGVSWCELAAERLRAVTQSVVFAGSGELPPSLAGHSRLPDSPGIQGPLAGMVAAMRWNPWASWIFSACDMPFTSAASLGWLLDQRRPGVWAVLPRAGEIHPLLAYYDFRIHEFLESLAMSGKYAVTAVASHGKTIMPSPPEALRSSWANFNRPEEVSRAFP